MKDYHKDLTLPGAVAAFLNDAQRAIAPERCAKCGDKIEQWWNYCAMCGKYLAAGNRED